MAKKTTTAVIRVCDFCRDENVPVWECSRCHKDGCALHAFAAVLSFRRLKLRSEWANVIAGENPYIRSTNAVLCTECVPFVEEDLTAQGFNNADVENAMLRQIELAATVSEKEK